MIICSLYKKQVFCLFYTVVIFSVVGPRSRPKVRPDGLRIKRAWIRRAPR